MKVYGLRLLGIAFLLAALVCARASAAVTRYDAPIEADGRTLGIASGSLDLSTTADGVAWALSNGRFAPAALPHATVVFNEQDLSGSGSAPAAETVTLKEFNVTVAQSTGVDVTYRFRFTVTLDNGAVRSVAIRQMK